MTVPSRKEGLSLVRSWGFSHVFAWTDSPSAYYSPHSHTSLTTHLILSGSMIISYPDDPEPKKETFGPGARVDVEGGRRHEVWMGEDTECCYVVGE